MYKGFSLPSTTEQRPPEISIRGRAEDRLSSSTQFVVTGKVKATPPHPHRLVCKALHGAASPLQSSHSPPRLF